MTLSLFSRTFAAGPCDPLPPDDNDIRHYACNCYDRLGITAAQFEAIVGNGKDTCDCTAEGQGEIKPLDTTKEGRKQAKACGGDRNCDAVADFPGICDRPAWLQLVDPPQRCYGHSFIHKYVIPSTKPDPSIVEVAFLCRKKKFWSDRTDDFTDVAVIMRNDQSGETCWFQTQDSAKMDGTKVPAPHTNAGIDDNKWWMKPETAAVVGDVQAGRHVGCMYCHDNGPFMNSRWMFESNIRLHDGKREYKTKDFMGAGFTTWEELSFVSVGRAGLESADQKKLKTCTACHRIAAKRKTCEDWIDFTTGMDDPKKADGTRWNDTTKGKSYEERYWMPPLLSLKKAEYEDEKKGYKKHLVELLACCAAGAGGPGCKDGLKVALGPASPLPGVHLHAAINGNWLYDSDAQVNPDPPAVPIDSGTRLSLAWNADANHRFCSIEATLPPGVEVNGTGSGTTWGLGDSNPRDIGTLIVPGLYHFEISCDDDVYTQLAASLSFLVHTPSQVFTHSPTVLRVDAIVDGVRTSASDYPCPDQPHADVGINMAACARVAWLAYNVKANTCVLSETFTPSGGRTPRVFTAEAGIMEVPLYGMTDQKYQLDCTGLDGQPHSVDVTLHVMLPASWTGDTDGDGVPDCHDDCPADSNKVEAGACDCGVPDVDSDGDTVPDCIDECPADPNKLEPGMCGCGTADSRCGAGCGTIDPDNDGDGTPDCIDACPADPLKTEAGGCGCGTPEPVCGGPCGVADPDSDGDGTPDCRDGCPNDPDQIDPGVCGCGLVYTDTDADGTPDCVDGCPNDPDKTSPGTCGCGLPDSVCGCGLPDTDTDSDGTPDCHDACPLDPDKTVPGLCGCGTLDSFCGCGVAESDDDCDGTPDCIDGCPGDYSRIAPGLCGCRNPASPAQDADGDGDVDLDDFGRFQICYNPVGLSPGCDCFDHNDDGVIDPTDLAAFAACAKRAGLPADPNCSP